MFRIAQNTDREPVANLFWQVFGGTLEFATSVFDDFAGANNVFVAEDEGTIISCLCAVPVSLMGRQGVYFYGLATAPDHRGKRRMTELMEYAKTQLILRGKSFAVLIPADEGLFNFYENRGFETAFRLRHIQRSIKNNLWAQAEFDTITASGLERMRKRYAPHAVMLQPSGWRCVLTDLYTGGLTTVASDAGYGLYFKKGDTLEFIELFAEGDRAAEKLIEAARQKTGATTAHITLAQYDTMFLGEGKPQDYGMIQFWADRFDTYDAYMRLMLDNE